MKDSNYLPQILKVIDVRDLTSNTKLFRLGCQLDFNPGQFVELSVIGAGEIPVVPTNHPSEDFLELAVRKVGTVTEALHQLKVGDQVGLRGPFGNGFPLDKLRGQNLILVAGGLGLAPLRPLVKEIIGDRTSYGEVHLLYGCRDAAGFLFKNDLSKWEDQIEVHQTVDEECAGWSGRVGLVTNLFEEINFPEDNISAVLCGPPVMFKFVIEKLKKLPVPDDKIFMSLERQMKCGVGKCQHCTVGKFYVCIDGPVFSYDLIKNEGIVVS